MLDTTGPRSATNVLLLTALPAQEEALTCALHQRRVPVKVFRGSQVRDAATLSRIDVVLGWRLPSGVAEHLSSLRWVCSMAAGVEKLLVPGLRADVPISRVVDPEQALGMAQFAALMVLNHLRGLPRYAQQQRERQWTRHPVPVSRERVAVLGLGEVGREVARALSSLGLPVQGWRRDGTPLQQVLADAQVVVNCLPLTDQTAGILDAQAFAAMPRGAYLVNLARGGHVIEPDLIAAVRSGHLAGAALDVQQHEPMPADDPLWSIPGITITPHIASQPSHETVADQFVAGLRCFLNGDPIPNLIDRARGY